MIVQADGGGVDEHSGTPTSCGDRLLIPSDSGNNGLILLFFRLCGKVFGTRSGAIAQPYSVDADLVAGVQYSSGGASCTEQYRFAIFSMVEQ